MARLVIEEYDGRYCVSLTEVRKGPFGIGHMLPLAGLTATDAVMFACGFDAVLKSDVWGATWLRMNRKKIAAYAPKSPDHAHALDIIKLMGMECQMRARPDWCNMHEYKALRASIIEDANRDVPLSVFSRYNTAVMLASQYPPVERDEVLKYLKKAYCWQVVVAQMNYGSVDYVKLLIKSAELRGPLFTNVFNYGHDVAVAWFKKHYVAGAVSDVNIYTIVCVVLRNVYKTVIPSKVRIALETMLGWLQAKEAKWCTDQVGESEIKATRERYRGMIESSVEAAGCCNVCSVKVTAHGTVHPCGHITCNLCELRGWAEPCRCDEKDVATPWCPYSRHHLKGVLCPMCGAYNLMLGKKSPTPGGITCHPLEEQERMLLCALSVVDTLESEFVEGQREFIDHASHVGASVVLGANDNVGKLLETAKTRLCLGKSVCTRLRASIYNRLACVLRLKAVSAYYYDRKKSFNVPVKNYVLQALSDVIEENTKGNFDTTAPSLLADIVYNAFYCDA